MGESVLVRGGVRDVEGVVDAVPVGTRAVGVADAQRDAGVDADDEAVVDAQRDAVADAVVADADGEAVIETEATEDAEWDTLPDDEALPEALSTPLLVTVSVTLPQSDAKGEVEGDWDALAEAGGLLVTEADAVARREGSTDGVPAEDPVALGEPELVRVESALVEALRVGCRFEGDTVVVAHAVEAAEAVNDAEGEMLPVTDALKKALADALAVITAVGDADADRECAKSAPSSSDTLAAVLTLHVLGRARGHAA